jgi:D-arginine dehydrogenase
LVLGAGMAGVSLAAELAAVRDTVLIEIEEQPGRHATGRSAAMFFESYGNATIRALTRASRRFLESPPAGFAEVPLMTPRDTLVIAPPERVERLDELAAMPAARFARMDPVEACRRVPILRAERIGGVLCDEAGRDIDMAALLQGYLKVARRRGARIVLGAGEVRVEGHGDLWQVRTPLGEWCAPVVVDACGAWVDTVAAGAGVRPIGLQPLRRSAALIPPPTGTDVSAWPAVVDADETFYFKPDAGQLLLSPANEDPSPPCDAAPDELDIAVAVDRFERATSLPVRRVTHRWAGLRSFVADRTPVVGFDDLAPGFFWLAGQGGYGIQTAPAMARTAAALVVGDPVPADIADQGVTAEALSPARAVLQRGR